MPTTQRRIYEDYGSDDDMTKRSESLWKRRQAILDEAEKTRNEVSGRKAVSLNVPEEPLPTPKRGKLDENEQALSALSEKKNAAVLAMTKKKVVTSDPDIAQKAKDMGKKVILMTEDAAVAKKGKAIGGIEVDYTDTTTQKGKQKSAIEQQLEREDNFVNEAMLTHFGGTDPRELDADSEYDRDYMLLGKDRYAKQRATENKRKLLKKQKEADRIEKYFRAKWREQQKSSDKGLSHSEMMSEMKYRDSVFNTMHQWTNGFLDEMSDQNVREINRRLQRTDEMIIQADQTEERAASELGMLGMYSVIPRRFVDDLDTFKADEKGHTQLENYMWKLLTEQNFTPNEIKQIINESTWSWLLDEEPETLDALFDEMQARIKKDKPDSWYRRWFGGES